MKKLTFTLLFSVLFFVSQAQDTKKIWEAIYSNDRATALQLANKIKTNKGSMEQIVLKQIVNVANGIYKKDKDFLTSFSAKPNFDYFLFPLWNTEFIFKDYLNQSFETEIITNVNYFAKQPINNPTVKAGMVYLDGIVARYQNDFEKQQKNDDSLLAIKNWQYCGVFENLNKSGMDTEYAPEKKAYSSEPFNANSNGFLNWFTPSYNLKSSYQFMTNFSEYGAGINYAQTFLNLDKQQTLIFKLGIGKATKMWVNDVLVFEETEDHITELDAHTIKITLPKGNNRILIKTTNNVYAYFILRVFNENNELLNPKDLNFTSSYTPYNKSTKTQLNSKILPNRIETFFNNLDSANTTYFKDYLLIKTYLRNSKEKLAKKIIEKYLKKYPKSSFFRYLLMECYNIESDYTKSKEILENIKNDDENNVAVLITEITDAKKLFNMPIDQMNDRLKKIANATDSKLIKKTTAFFKYIRLEDKKAFKKTLDEIYAIGLKRKNQKLLSSFASLYGSMFNQESKSLKLLLDIDKNFFSHAAHNSLIYKYEKLNKNDKVISLIDDFINKFPEDMSLLEKMVKKLHKYQEYKKSLKYIDKAFKMFPYSFVFMKLKGETLYQLKKEKEALKWFKKSYTHDSGNTSLRKKIQDLEKKDDPIKKVVLEKAYDYISETRGKAKTDVNFGLNVLLDEKNVQVFKEGGSKSQSIYIYEITSEEGVEMLKEYNLGLSYGYTINKSEIVKPNGKVIPAERSGSKFVFNNLSVNDVIYIDFETTNTTTGRFYKDFYDTYQIGSFYPVLKTVYRLILPEGTHINTKVLNGDIAVNKAKIGNYDLYEWAKENSKVLPAYETYMPEDCDVVPILNISSIDKWSDISNWYSDLVRTQIKYNSTVNQLFDKLFPDGFQNLSDTEKAKKIYYYMMNNLTYSFVNFKQSGYVPQKPSKTITSKMGDCKDFSTLFFTLAQKAGLKSNLVLVSTSDLGKNAMVLPSTEFNHCIVRVNLEGKEHYIELTNKFLPFNSTPNSLINALALNIPYNSSDTNQNNLFILNKTVKTAINRTLDVDLTIDKTKQDLQIKNTSFNTNSYYRELLDQKNTIELKKQLEELYEGKSKLDLTLIDYNIEKNVKEDPEVIFNSHFTINNEIKKIGKMKLLKLPRLSKPYTNDIISLDERKYPIIYNKYETVDQYLINYYVRLADGQKFIEVPENVALSYKKHYFTITYTLKNQDTMLVVNIKANIDKSDIQANEYKAYKDFVKNVLEESEALIGFK